MSCRSVFCCLSNNYMISFKSSKCNIISQSQYDSEIRRICSCISFLVLSADHVLLSSTVTIKEGSAFLTALNSSLSEYSVSSARTAAEHMHFFLISGCLVLQFLFHLFLLLLLLPVISSLLSRIPSILWQTDFFIHLLNGTERFHRTLILSCAFFLSTNITETLFPLWMLFNVSRS